jgi:4-cresol dehydrogenase (hydroxylating)
MTTPLAKAGYWTAFGGLYGSRRQVAARRKDLRSALRGVGPVKFLSDRSLGRLQGLMASPGLGRLGWAVKTRTGLRTLEYIHGLGKGVPSDLGLQGVAWRITRPEDVGFFWCGPTLEASGTAVREVLEITGALFERYGFEMPVTMSFVRPDRLVATVSCTFNRNDDVERESAHTLYFRLRRELATAGYPQYRSSILGMGDVAAGDEGRAQVLERLKGALDPKRVIAPGRYGLR